MNKDYPKWVKDADIHELLNAYIELHDEYVSALQDCEVYDESCKEIEENLKLVKSEIVSRTK
jgi:hypothetical protein